MLAADAWNGVPFSVQGTFVAHSSSTIQPFSFSSVLEFQLSTPCSPLDSEADEAERAWRTGWPSHEALGLRPSSGGHNVDSSRRRKCACS